MSRRLLAATIVGVVALLASTTAAFANTTNATSTKVVAVVNPSGTVTVTVSGTWTWPPTQDCSKRYGTGWVVSWWGIGSANPLPSNNFQLLSMSAITSSDQGINGTSVDTLTNVSATNSIKFPNGLGYDGEYFYLPPNYNGEEIFTKSFCDTADPNNTGTFNGTYTATATYPNESDVPKVLCVNTYDEHGSQGNPTTKPGATLGNDFLPNKDGDNSIQKSQWVNSENCGTTSIIIVPAGGSIGGLGLAALIGVALLAMLGGGAVIRRRRPGTARP